MSQLTNVITTTFRARDGGLVAQLGSYSQGFGNIYNRLQANSRMSDRLNAQWRAFGTTIRYAIAGQTIFGLTRMVGQLRDINSQLGEMAALTTPGTGGSAFSNRQVTQLGKDLQRVSIDTIQPLSQVQDAAINFLSTVQNVRPGPGLPEMLTDISRAAQLAQTDLTTLNQAATTSQVAFQRPVDRRSIGQYTRMWQELIFQAPGGPQASTTIAQAMPGLASMFQLAPGTSTPGNVGQAQMMALTLGVLRTGMPAATAMRGLTYLLQSVAQPTGKARGALAQIGITPQFVEQQGIFPAVMKLLQTITATGNPRQLGALDDTTLDTLDETGGRLPGIPAQEMTRLREMIPRIHGIRAAIILASQLQRHGNVTSLSENLNNMLAVQDEQSRQSRALAQAWQRFQDRSRLKEAANALNTMSIQVAQTFEPVLGFVAQHALTPAAHAMQRHRRATEIGTIAGAGLLGLSLGRRFFRGAGGALVGVNAGRAALEGSAVLGGSPQNPMYVVVVAQLYGPGGILGGKFPGRGGGGAVAEAEKEAERAAKTGGLLGLARAAIGGVRRLPGALERGFSGGRLPGIAGRLGLGASIFDYFYNAQNAGSQGENLYALAAQKFPGQNITQLQTGFIHGQAEVFLTIDQGGKITHKRFHIPLSMMPQGNRVPSHRGTPGKTGHRG